jgi:hypothetical protein
MIKSGTDLKFGQRPLAKRVSLDGLLLVHPVQFNQKTNINYPIQGYQGNDTVLRLHARSP